MTIKEITEDIRQNVSIYSIFTQNWKQKEMLVKIEGIKRRMQNELNKSYEIIEIIKNKI